MQPRGRVFSREQLLQQLWEDPFFGDPRTVDVHIRWIREQIEDDPSQPQRLRTIRGVGYQIVTVADTGVGIATTDLPHIFDRFFKADPSRHDGGMGLGLAIAQQLAERHGGRIWAESALGQGTVVSFALPVAVLQVAPLVEQP